MDVKDIDIKISKELLPYIGTIRDGGTMNDKANLSLILGLFASGTVTLEKASELAERSVWDFVEILNAHHIPWGECTEEERQMDRAAIEKLAGGFYE